MLAADALSRHHWLVLGVPSELYVLAAEMSWLYTYRLCSFILVIALALGVVTLCVQTEGSKAFVLVDSDRTFNVLYAHVGIVTGIYSAALLCISLIRDSCHRPLVIAFELALLALPSIAWIVVAVMALVQNGQNFKGSVCNDPDSTANDICRYTVPIVGLSVAVALILILYSLVLLFVACVGARRGKPIWMCPVPRGSAQRRNSAAQDLEARATEKPNV